MSVRITAPDHVEPVHEADLLAYFQTAGKPRPAWRVGVEFERFAVERTTGRHLRYDEPGGIRDLLHALHERFGWTPFVNAGGHLTALARDGATVSIEPGGQLEFATAPVRTLHDAAAARAQHCDELRAVADLERVAFLTAGVAPLAAVADIPLMPRARHAVMAEFLPPRSPTALTMMKATASVQAAFDYADEADAARKLTMALTLGPVVNALWGNAPLSEGRVTGHASHRGRVWAGMDPARSGLMVELLEAGVSFRGWVDYLLDVPLMVTHIDGEYRKPTQPTFRAFMERGEGDYFPTLSDWELQITTVFPEVRLKRFLEVRGADAVAAPLALAVPAVWKGLLYDDDALVAACDIAATIPPRDLPALFEDAYCRGLAAEYAGRTLIDWNRELIDLAGAGLDRQGAGEGRYLDPVRELLDRGQSPGEAYLASGPDPGDAAAVVAWFEDCDAP